MLLQVRHSSLFLLQVHQGPTLVSNSINNHPVQEVQAQVISNLLLRGRQRRLLQPVVHQGQVLVNSNLSNPLQDLAMPAFLHIVRDITQVIQTLMCQALTKDVPAMAAYLVAFEVNS